jgi:hypothetical protein
MRKRQAAITLARRLGVKLTRLINITQRLAEAGMLPVSHGPPFPQLHPVEVARMLIAAVVDDGIAAAPATVARYGGLLGRGSNLEDAIGHALARPITIVPSKSSLIIHSGYALLTTSQPDGRHTAVFGEIDDEEPVGRIVQVSGAALRGIAEEFGCRHAAEVDALLGSSAN